MKTLQQKIEIMQAFARGEKIEVTEIGMGWRLIEAPSWDWSSYDYRVAETKPEPVKLKLIAWLDTTTLQLQWFAEGCDINWNWKRVPSEDKEITLP